MKKSTKRILSLFLVLMMVVSLFPTAYAAETGEVIEDEGYGSSWEDWDVQPAEEGAPIEEEPTDPFVEEPVEEPAPVEEPVEEPAPVEEPVDEPAPVEEPVVEEEPEVSYPANTFYYVGGSGLRVTVDAPEGAFPIDAEMSVSELPASFVQDVVAASGVEGQVLVAADISFANGEGELQPNGKVKVSITSAEAAKVSNVKVVHIDDNYNVEEVNQLPEFDANVLFTDAVATMSVADERTLSFEADSFSVYAIIGEVVIEDEEGSFDFETEEYKITVSYTAEAQIPLGTHLVVSQIPDFSDEYFNLWNQSLAKLNENAVFGTEVGENAPKGLAAAVFFDVSLIYEGQKIEPAVPLQVDIQLKNDGLLQITGEETKVVHFGDKGTELIDDVAVAGIKPASEGIPDGVFVSDFSYVQDGFSVVGVVTTDEYINYDPTPYSLVTADALLAAAGLRAAGDPTINAGKTVTDSNGDGIYELALSVNATSQQSQDTSVTKSNVVMVIDVSGSMDTVIEYNEYTYNASTYNANHHYFNGNGNNPYRVVYDTNQRRWEYTNGTRYTGTVYRGVTRLDSTKDAACAVVDALLAYNTNADNITDIFEITVVKFANRTANTQQGYNGTQMVIRDSTDAAAIKSAINGLTAGGGTNWQAALETALTEANYYKNTDTSQMHDPEENTSVIFLTDGFPTFYSNDQGYGSGTYYSEAGRETDDNIALCYTNSRSAARNIVSNGYTLYNIFAFGSDTTTHNNHTGFAYLRALTNYAYGSGNNDNYNETDITRQYSFNAKSTADLVAAFKTIIDHITNSVGYAGVNLTDGVSLGATSTTVAVNGTAKPDSMRYTVKDDTGNISYTVKINSSGAATFTIYNADGTTTTLTDSAAEEKTTTINGTEIKSKIYEVTVGSGDTAKTYKMAPAEIDGQTGMVTWNLAALGILESGYTYTVAFDVWPNQLAYDICADLNNRIYDSVDEALTAYNVTDEDEQQRIKDALVHNDDGSYSLYTNYEQSVEYYPATSSTNDEGETTWTYGEKQSQDLPHPDPIPLKGSLLPLKKVWESDLSVSELNELLWENGEVGGTSKKYQITLYIWKADTKEEIDAISVNQTGHDPYITKVLGWDEATSKYVFEKDVAVAPGMMLNVDAAAELGYNTSDSSKIKTFTNDQGTTLTYYVIEDGHYFFVSEDGSDLHFELDAPIYHPMIVDGTLYNVAFGEGQTVETMDPMHSVTATNTLKGGLNISKVVSTTQINVTDGVIGGVTQPVDDDGIKTVTDEFTYEIQIWKEDENGAKTAVYTTPDQIKSDGSGTISGSVGYRIFSEPRLVDGSIKYTQARGAILTESDPNASLANGIYATIANGVTTITLTMPANGEIRLVNLPSNTKYTVREIVEDGGAYAYAATLSQQKLSDTEVTEGTVSTGNTVSGSVPGNTAAVETYYNWAASFYVYHSSDNTVEKISFADPRVKGTYDADSNSYSYEFNIALETKSGFIYGGYYKAYSKSSGDTAVKALTFTGTDAKTYTYDAEKTSSTKAWATDSAGEAYVGGPNIWVKDDAYTESGLEMGPIADTVYYLKEVPDIYLTPAAYVVYDEVAKVVDEASGKDFYPVMKLYMISFTDDANYADTGFDMSVSKGLTPPTHDVFWGEKITVTKKGEEQDPITVDGLVKGKAGLVTLLDATTLITKNAYYREIPYHVTLDGVKVTSIRQMTVFVRDTTFNVEPGWIKPGMTRTTISKKAAVEVTSTVEP